MKYKCHLFKVLLFSLVFSNIYAQSSDKSKIMELFAKTKKVYESTNLFKMEMTYRLYPTYKSNVVTEKYDGLILKKDKNFYSKIGNTEFVNLKNEVVKIDNESKLIQYNEKTEEQPMTYDMTMFISNFNVFELSSSGDYWICTLTSPEITFVPYGKVIVTIHKTNFTIVKQVFYLLVESKYKTKSGKVETGYPRMEIVFGNFETKGVEIGTKFMINTYINQDNKKNTPSKNYKNYTVVN